MTYDLTHLFNRETITVSDTSGQFTFDVTVREITHGDAQAAQNAIMAEMEILLKGTKARKDRAMQDSMTKAIRNGASTKIAIAEELAAIDSWTLTDSQGNAVPVCEDVWLGLPNAISNQIVEVIERLNPSLDTEFRNDDGNEG